MIKASDCRFTTAQCKGLLTSNKVKAAADKNDQRSLDMLVFSESKRLGIMPKGRTATPQPAAQPPPPSKPEDGWRTQQRRSTKKKQERTPSKPEEETSHVAL
eukprot:1617509-Amphidinium_carterae.1